MSDTPHPDPLDEQASDLFDAGADAPGDEPELGARLDEFRSLREALADVPPAPDDTRSGALAAALALFDELQAEGVAAAPAPADDTPTDDPPTDDAAAPPPAPIPLVRRQRQRRVGGLLGLAAAVVLVVGAVALFAGRDGDGNVDSAGSAVIDSGGGSFQASKDAGDVAAASTVAAAAPAAESSSGGASDTTAGAAASSTVARSSTAGGGTTTAASVTDGLSSADETTSTTDRRDVTTTAAVAPSTTSPPTTTSTNVDASALPYLGELTTNDELAAAVATLPPFDAADAGAPIRAQLAGGICDLREVGTPIAVARWNGRDSVVLRSPDRSRVLLVPLDGCNPIVQLDAPS